MNAVRQRSDPTTVFTASSKADLIEKILNERRIEFLGEGLRNGDLMRLGLPIPAKTPAGSTPVPTANLVIITIFGQYLIAKLCITHRLNRLSAFSYLLSGGNILHIAK